MQNSKLFPIKQLLLTLAAALALSSAPSLLADDAEALVGKWTTKKTNDQGQSYNQTLEIKKGKFVFEIHDADNQVAIHAEGDFKLEKLGPFNSARFIHIRGGSSASDLSDIDDEYTGIYTLDGDTWKMAMNFDKERDQKPGLDLYQRTKAAAGQGGGTLVIDSIEMADTPQGATWYFCFDAKLGAVTRRYHVENKGFDKNQVTIPVALEIPKVEAGQKCSFKMQLDDVAGDECDEADNSSTGEFTISEKGSQTFKPEDHWKYTISWHLK
jgi:hypothetical protein